VLRETVLHLCSSQLLVCKCGNDDPACCLRSCWTERLQVREQVYERCHIYTVKVAQKHLGVFTKTVLCCSEVAYIHLHSNFNSIIL